MNSTEQIKQTRLFSLHQAAGAKMVPFAGYQMPVNYPQGIIKEHLHTRHKAGLFDVSHMGQISVRGPDAGKALEALMPIDVLSLLPGQQRYGLLLNQSGGIIDDLMISNVSHDHYMLVVNAACKDNDFKHLKSNLDNNLEIEIVDKSLIALQGPSSAGVLARLGVDCQDMPFMTVREMHIAGIHCTASRSGYTGEDGFELSVCHQNIEKLCELLINDEEVNWVGLGARDSLRLEAGLCLYGHDMDSTTSPVEASLLWAISKARRKEGERPGGFPGDNIILQQIPDNINKKRIAMTVEGKAPVREGAVLQDMNGHAVGSVTSGGFSPSLGKPICMGYVDIAHSNEHTPLCAIVRNKLLPVNVSKLPFVARRYYRIT